MHMHFSTVKGYLSLQFKPKEEIENGEFAIKSASTDELRQAISTDFMHRVDDTTSHLDPIRHLRPLERTLVLTKLNRLMRPQDHRKEIISKAPVGTAVTVRIQPHQLRPRSATLDRRDGIPRILASEYDRRSFGVLVADPISGMEAIELMLEHGREHTDMFERLQREPALPVADMDVEATGFVHKDVEFPREQFDHARDPPQRLGAKAQRRRFDLDIALK